MRDLPPVRYATIGNESLAYRDMGGDGPALVYLGSQGSHQDVMWEEPRYAHFLRSLAALGRLITFDRRGSGLSSHTVRPTIEFRVDDIACILDTLGLDEAVLIGACGSSQVALAFAATRPDRARALALYAPMARTTEAPGYEGYPREAQEAVLAEVDRVWGTGITAFLYAPTFAHDAQFLSWAGKNERAIATPLEARDWIRMYNTTDVRGVLASVQAPTLVVTPTKAEPPLVVTCSRYVAAHLANVRTVEIDAMDQWPFGDGMNEFLKATEDFLPSVLNISLSARPDRRLAAVLFTDIVSSTEQLQAAGDRQWRALLDSHDEVSEQCVSRYGGRVVKSTGDGTLAVFSGPAQAVDAALDMLQALQRIGLSVRAGVHVAEIEERGDDVSGIAVHVGSRIAGAAGAGEVLVSTTVRDLVAGSGLTFTSRGERAVKGLAEPIALLAATRRNA
jgi:class 3 adenylate cyclase